MGVTGDFRKNLNSCRDFYVATIQAYAHSISYNLDQPEPVVQLSLTPHADLELSNLRLNLHRSVQDINRMYRSDFTHILRESLLLRLISSLEDCLLSAAKLIFLQRKDVFGKIQQKLDIHVNQLYALGSMSEIYSFVIARELKKVQDASIKEKAEYFDKYFGIKLNLDEEMWKRIVEYHARRNLIVHRLGKIDEKYSREYNNNSDRIYVPKTYILQCFDDMYAISHIIGMQLRQLFDEKSPKPFVFDYARAAVRFYALGERAKQIQEKGFAFQSGAKVIMLADIGTLTVSDTDIIVDIEGKASYVNSFIGLVKSLEWNREIGGLKYEYFYRYTKKKTLLDPKFIETVISLYETEEDKDLAAIEITSKMRMPMQIVALALRSHAFLPTPDIEQSIRDRLKGYRDFGAVAEDLGIPVQAVYAVADNVRYERAMNLLK